MVKKLSTSQDFRNILNQYNIGSFKSRKYIDFAIENENYVIITTKGEFFLKVFDTKSLKYLKFQHGVIEYLYSKKVKVAPIILTKDKKSLIKYKGRFVTLYKFMEGRHLGKLSNVICKSLAKEVSIMHKNLLRYKPKRTERHLPYSKNVLEGINTKKLRKAIIHGDLGEPNILIKNNKIIAILDFADSRYDYLVYDVGILIADIFLTKNNLKYLDIFLKEYNKHIKFNNEEKKAVPSFVKLRIESAISWFNQIIREKKYTQAQLKWIQKGIKKYEKRLEMLDQFKI